jgi:hypothetical protein
LDPQLAKLLLESVEYKCTNEVGINSWHFE